MPLTKLFINYKQNVQPDHNLAVKIESFLKKKDSKVFRDESALKGGDQWPSKIHENLKQADIMISLVSNNSMNSDWVINEIDEARRLRKIIIPIMLEELDEKIRFTRYQPRFTDIQYIALKEKEDELFNEILISMLNLQNSPPTRSLLQYRKIVSATLEKHGLDSSDELLCHLLAFMQDFHIVPAAAAEINSHQCFPKLIDGGFCRSFPEALTEALEIHKEMQRHNYENGLKRNHEANWYWEEKVGPSACLADIFSTALEKWEPLVKRAKKQMIDIHTREKDV